MSGNISLTEKKQIALIQNGNHDEILKFICLFDLPQTRVLSLLNVVTPRKFWPISQLVPCRNVVRLL